MKFAATYGGARNRRSGRIVSLPHHTGQLARIGIVQTSGQIEREVAQRSSQIRTAHGDKDLFQFIEGLRRALRLNRRGLIRQCRDHIYISSDPALNLQVQRRFQCEVLVRADLHTADQRTGFVQPAPAFSSRGRRRRR